MKSGLRRLAGLTNRSGPPVPIAGAGGILRGHSFNLSAGQADAELLMKQYSMSGTIFSIVSLLAETAATPCWRLYRSAPVDGRRRYATGGDQGSDQRTEVVQHAALKLWNAPNGYCSGFEFREGAQQHQELTGRTCWVLDMEAGFPTSMWYVRPDRMQPSLDDYGSIAGWIYTGPAGEQVPLRANEVICEKRPDPLDPHGGLGPVQAIMPNIQQQRYATEYQRNLFLNGASPGGVIMVPNRLSDRDFDDLVERWRESHRGVARAGHVGVLEAGATWEAASPTNRDMEYGELRKANREEMREAWRVHSAMLGMSEEVNRANAQTAEEVFIAWQVIPRLNRRRETLNNKLLPLFGGAGQGVEFDYDDPSPENAESAALELLNKANAAKVLVDAGYDHDDVLETVGLPSMDVATTAPAPAVAPQAAPVQPDAAPTARERARITAAAPAIAAKKDAGAKVYQQVAEDYPAHAVAWMHHAAWKGPVEVPADHIDPTFKWMAGADPDHVHDFVEKLQAGKKLKPVILVKTPAAGKLTLIDGHHRFLAACELKVPIRAWIGTVDADHGDWETMHDYQYPRDGDGDGGTSNSAGWVDQAALLQRILSDGWVPIQVGGR